MKEINFELNPSAYFMLPILDLSFKDIPHFIDCGVTKDTNNIVIYTKISASNRYKGYGDDILIHHKNFKGTKDISLGCGEYKFEIPLKWVEDFKHLLKYNFNLVSKEYVEQIKKTYPELVGSPLSTFIEMFGNRKEDIPHVKKVTVTYSDGHIEEIDKGFYTNIKDIAVGRTCEGGFFNVSHDERYDILVSMYGMISKYSNVKSVQDTYNKFAEVESYTSKL